MSKRYAVIEIGSRGLRLLIGDISKTGAFQSIYSTGDLSGLGKDLTETGTISPKSTLRIKNIVKSYYGIAEEHHADQIFAFATEAVRSAPNRTEFLTSMADIIEVHVLKKEEEAACSFMASVNAFHKQLPVDTTALVVDQGGGSTELSCGLVKSDGKIVLQDFTTLPIGTVSLTKTLIESDSYLQGFTQAKEGITSIVSGHKRFRSLSQESPVAVFGLGSAITIMANQLNPNAKAAGKSVRQVHGQYIETAEILKFIGIIETRLKELDKNRNMRLTADSDLTTFIIGIITYSSLLQRYDAPGITVSRWGLRYGVLFNLAGQDFELGNDITPETDRD